MAGGGPDPAALLSIYVQYDRLTDAADLVLEHLAAYQKVLSAVESSLLICHDVLLSAAVSATQHFVTVTVLALGHLLLIPVVCMSEEAADTWLCAHRLMSPAGKATVACGSHFVSSETSLLNWGDVPACVRNTACCKQLFSSTNILP